MVLHIRKGLSGSTVDPGIEGHFDLAEQQPVGYATAAAPPPAIGPEGQPGGALNPALQRPEQLEARARELGPTRPLTGLTDMAVNAAHGAEALAEPQMAQKAMDEGRVQLQRVSEMGMDGPPGTPAQAYLQGYLDNRDPKVAAARGHLLAQMSGASEA